LRGFGGSFVSAGAGKQVTGTLRKKDVNVRTIYGLGLEGKKEGLKRDVRSQVDANKYQTLRLKWAS